MPESVWAKVHQGKIELLGPVELPEGASVLVTVFPASEPPPVTEPSYPYQPEPDVWIETELEDGIWDADDNGGKPFLPLSPSLQASRFQ
jgi:hypothetical protein